MESAARTDDISPARGTRRYLIVVWGLLLLLGAFFVFAALSDLRSDAATGLPSDHAGAFQSLAGSTWSVAKHAAPGVARYVTLLEYAYAVHELVFGVLFLIIVAIPLRQGARWAWWASWVVILANVTYSLTFGRHDPVILRRSLIADVALPVLLLILLPAFYGKRRGSLL